MTLIVFDKAIQRFNILHNFHISLSYQHRKSMNIYITKNQQKHGPYTAAEVRSKIASGQFAETDTGWHDGVTGLLPLSQLLASMTVGSDGAPPIPQKSSGLASASFIIALIGIGAWFVLIVASAVGVSSGANETSPLLIVVSLLMFVGMAANLAGAIFGIVALTKTISNRWMAVTGAIANIVEIVGVLFLVVLGLAQK